MYFPFRKIIIDSDFALVLTSTKVNLIGDQGKGDEQMLTRDLCELARAKATLDLTKFDILKVFA